MVKWIARPVLTRTLYRIGAVEIDSAMRMIRRDGSTVHLRARSFDALLYLVENRGMVVTKEVLLDTFWKDSSVTENSLAQSIKDVRQALGDDPKNPFFIRTIPKVGYSFIAPIDEDRRPVEVPAVGPETGVSAVKLRLVVAAIALIAIIAAVGLVRMHRPDNLTGDEVAWWKFDEGQGAVASDSGGGGLHGVLNGHPRWTDGKLGKALLLDGLGTYASGDKLNRLPMGNTPRTVTAWVKSDADLTDDSGIFDYGASWPGPAGRNFVLAMTRQGTVSVSGVTGASKVSDRLWHQIAANWDGEAVRLYVDGNLDATNKLGRKLETGSSQGWTIGRYLREGTPFRGAIDDVRVYGRALKTQEVQALYRCSLGTPDIKIGGAAHYFLPILYDGLSVDAGADEIRNDGRDLTGVQFARSDGVCSTNALRGAPVGQNLEVKMELMVPSGAAGHSTGAGPYLRSRRAYAGDGLMGGTSAGYFVQLDSHGVVKIRLLYPRAVVAFSAALANFDPAVYHSLEVLVKGEVLRVTLDGREVLFDQGRTMTKEVAIPAEWEKLTPRGQNEGTAGIAFFTEDRGQIGGQRARKIRVTALE